MKRYFLSILILIFILGISGFYIFKYYGKSGTKDISNLREAMYWESLGGNTVRCNLCPHYCVLRAGQRGLCKVKENIGGKLYALNYGKAVAVHNDPIEKKPFFHVLPGSSAFSIAGVGCNVHCLFCQNWQIAQVFPEDIEAQELPPEKVVEQALKSGASSIAYTYSEPVAFYEYMIETAKIARQNGLKNVVVTAAYINPEPLRELCKYVDAIKIDLKGFDEGFYRKFIGAHLQPVLESLKIVKEEGVWLEIVNLLIPGENDDPKSIREMAEWIKENLGEDVPLHFSRFYPMYKLKNLPSTPKETVIRARKIALEVGLKYVYTGNIYYPEGEATYCPESGEKVIQRQGYFVKSNELKDGQCPSGEKIPGIWE